jgi:hypothetical protein
MLSRTVMFISCLLASAIGWTCDTAPSPDCPTAAPKSAQLLLDNHLRPTFLRQRVIWEWAGFPAETADLGSPDTTTSLELCIFDYAGGTPILKFALAIPAGGQCGSAACWTATPTGWAYRSTTGDPDGINIVQFVGNDALAGSIVIRGSGPQLPPWGLALAQDPEVVAQLNTSDDRCWTSNFHGAKRNNRGQFWALSD